MMSVPTSASPSVFTVLTIYRVKGCAPHPTSSRVERNAPNPKTVVHHTPTSHRLEGSALYSTFSTAESSVPHSPSSRVVWRAPHSTFSRVESSASHSTSHRLASCRVESSSPHSTYYLLKSRGVHHTLLRLE